MESYTQEDPVEMKDLFDFLILSECAVQFWLDWKKINVIPLKPYKYMCH